MARVLIVDDEPDIRLVVRHVLEAEDIKVIEAGNGEEALRKLKSKPVDLVLIDFLMPGMSGRELAERIRRDPKLKNLKLAFLTVANFGDVGETELKSLGILDYIKKPFKKDDLLRRVKGILKT